MSVSKARSLAIRETIDQVKRGIGGADVDDLNRTKACLIALAQRADLFPVDDIPRTKSGKITELAVRDVVHGREVKNKEALANPEALELFKDLPELQ